MYEYEIFGRQDKLEFFLRESKDYKCLRKILGVSGTLRLSSQADKMCFVTMFFKIIA